MPLEQQCPIIFAHRGASLHAPENTLSAFKLALDQGAAAVEFDVKLSSDDQIVIIHDQTVDRTTNGTGKVRSLSLSELKELDAGSHYDQRFCNERIPTLTDALQILSEDMLINIELTNYSSPFDKLPYLVAKEISHASVPDRIIISSFNPFALINFHRFSPTIPLAYLTFKGKSNSLMKKTLMKLLRINYIHPHKNDVNPIFIQAERYNRRKINAYTVNDPNLMKDFIRWGINGFFTDNVPVAISTCKSFFENNFSPDFRFSEHCV